MNKILYLNNLEIVCYLFVYLFVYLQAAIALIQKYFSFYKLSFKLLVCCRKSKQDISIFCLQKQ